MIDIVLVERVISKCYGEIRVLQDVADRVGSSPETLRREFARKTGVPISRFILNTRIEQAKNLLSGTEKPCFEICFAVGFRREDVGCRVFRRLVGVGMQEYRHRHHKTKKFFQ